LSRRSYKYLRLIALGGLNKFTLTGKLTGIADCVEMADGYGIRYTGYGTRDTGFGLSFNPHIPYKRMRAI
jgi:hypothetical protein